MMSPRTPAFPNCAFTTSLLVCCLLQLVGTANDPAAAMFGVVILLHGTDCKMNKDPGRFSLLPCVCEVESLPETRIRSSPGKFVKKKCGHINPMFRTEL